MASLIEEGTVELPEAETVVPDAKEDVSSLETQSSVEGKPEALKPEWLEDKYWDQEKQEGNYEALSKSYSNLRTEFNKRLGDKAGNEVKDYLTSDFIENEYIENLKDDPTLALALTAAQEVGLGVKQTQKFISKFVSEMESTLPEPVDSQAELLKLGKNGPHVVSGIKAWVDSLNKQGDITEEVHSELLRLGTTAAGIKALDVLRKKSGVLNIPTGEVVSGSKSLMGAQDWYAATYETHSEDGESKDAYHERMHEIGKIIFGESSGTFDGSSYGVS